jgi:hypothetical protein
MCNLRVFIKIHTSENSVEPTVLCVPCPCLLDRVQSEEARHLEINVISSPVELSYNFLMKTHNADFPLQVKQLLYTHMQLKLNVYG